MALNDTMPRNVAFIIGWRKKKGVMQRTPIGTGFVLGVRVEPPSPIGFISYLVTAAHVVRSEPETWVRFRNTDGTLDDVPIPEWQFHERDDVAVSVIDVDKPYDIAILPVPDFFPAGASGRHTFGGGDIPYRIGGGPGTLVERNRPMLGDRVYFIGLFSPIPSMGERNVPLVRSGTLAAWFQEGVPLRMPDGTVLEYTAHLIDCRSYAGFSGSPCFVQFPRAAGIGGVGRADEETELLGLISSHFDFKENAELTGEIAELGQVDIPIHLGVGVVTPVESIEELLNREDIVADRKQREEAHRKQAEDDRANAAATPDSVEPEGESEFDRFEDLTQKLVNTPKPQKDEDPAR